MIVNSDVSLQSAIGELREQYRVHRFVRVTIKGGRPRSLNQNDLSFVWYEQLARELREDDARGWRRFCKLTIGVPILRAEDEEYRHAYDAVIRPLPYETKLVAMDHWPVTSQMTTPQKAKYLDGMRDHFWKQHRVVLEAA